jgi:hypothetical protein
MALALTVAIASCRSGEERPPENLISESVMIQVLADFFLVEGVMIQLEYIHQKMPDSAIPHYQVLYEKHGITRDLFLESLDYYSGNPAQIDRIYDLAILELSKEQTRITKKQKE